MGIGAQVLLNISKDEKERARLTSEYKFAVDLQSKMVGASNDRALTIARNALRKNMSVEDISDITGLTHDEVEGLRVTA